MATFQYQEWLYGPQEMPGLNGPQLPMVYGSAVTLPIFGMNKPDIAPQSLTEPSHKAIVGVSDCNQSCRPSVFPAVQSKATFPIKNTCDIASDCGFKIQRGSFSGSQRRCSSSCSQPFIVAGPTVTLSWAFRRNFTLGAESHEPSRHIGYNIILGLPVKRDSSRHGEKSHGKVVVAPV